MPFTSVHNKLDNNTKNQEKDNVLDAPLPNPPNDDEHTNMYQESIRVKQHRLTLQLLECKMTEGASVHQHVQYMISLVEQLGKLNYHIDLEMVIDIILAYEHGWEIRIAHRVRLYVGCD